MHQKIPDILSRIVADKQAALSGLRGRRADLVRAATDRSPSRGFRAALLAHPPAVISEIKKASPSKGVFSEDFDPASIARSYEAGGAAALSVLTDEKYFQGSLADLRVARAAVSLPVLRKDFTIDEIQLIEAAAHGADAILLIAAILSEREMRHFRELADEFGMAALVEVHSREELASALASGAEIVGVNNRNLHTFEVTLETSLRLAELMPENVIKKVSESGIHGPEHVGQLAAAGFQAFLVGEHLMKSGDPTGALKHYAVMIVKICGLTTEEDTKAAVEAGAGALGFNFFARSPRYVTPEKAAALAALAPPRVLKVGVFVNARASGIREVFSAVTLDVAQLHGDCEAPDGVRVWRAFSASAGFDREQFEALDCEAVLVDAPAGERYGGTGETFDWSLVQGLKQRLVLAGGLGPDNVAAAIRQVRPWAVDACSRLESSPGRKDHRKVREFITAALGVEL